MSDNLDIIIFGASGLIGQYTVLKAVETLKNYRWAIAGRNEEKLQRVLHDVGIRTGVDLSDTSIFVSDACDVKKLECMTAKCRIVVNCSGPYQLLSERLITACISSGTHYVDLNADVYFMELMQFKYNEEAKKHNVYIVSACGFESIPVDIGVNFVKQNFNGTVNYIEAYTEYWCTDKMVFAPIASYSSWSSFILACAHLKEIPQMREKLKQRPFPYLKHKSCYNCILEDAQVVKGVCLPFPVIAQQVVEHSQYYFYDRDLDRPIQFHNYLIFPSYVITMCFFIWCVLVGILAQIEYTRELLLKYPRLWSLGFCSHGYPNANHMENTFFRITLNAVGWSEYAKNPEFEFKDPMNKRMKAKVCGVNPVYGAACTCVLVSAMTILEESDKLPPCGGVFSPGAAFAKTGIIETLDKYNHGPIFQLISS